ncbi:sugar ABC transporter permease [Halosimplex rubrum]|uniref:Sugar ABC transporter permease n=1 Tax=Halosimplex rubrum TaxID=869889 RepID=A0A7D5P3M0_9EURY|nr:sugar ABC transporter permease [Halosimplex rubrum]QLH78301.1 sugar ABC transporter permease [Halosimplex rubrum]
MATRSTSLAERVPLDRETVNGLLFAAPYLVLFGLFLLYPLLKGLYMSFFQWDLLNPGESEFVGLANYATLLNDPQFWTATVNTFLFVLLTVPVLLVVSLTVALGLNRRLAGTRLLQFIYFVPYVLTVSIVGVIWLQVYGANGIFTVFTEPFIGRVLDSTTLALPALALTTVWWQVGFYFAILLAARQNVSERLYEAAKLDGASRWQMTRDITLPQMKNAIIFVVIASTITQFQVFGQPYVMTNGGPVSSTTTMVYYLYSLGFETFDLGYGAAVGYVVLMVLIAVSLINFKVVESSLGE